MERKFVKIMLVAACQIIFSCSNNYNSTVNNVAMEKINGNNMSVEKNKGRHSVLIYFGQKSGNASAFEFYKVDSTLNNWGHEVYLTADVTRKIDLNGLVDTLVSFNPDVQTHRLVGMVDSYSEGSEYLEKLQYQVNFEAHWLHCYLGLIFVPDSLYVQFRGD